MPELGFFFVIPNYISDEIDRKLEAVIVKHPGAEKDRAELRSQLVAYFDEHGVVPEFDLCKSAHDNKDSKLLT